MNNSDNFKTGFLAGILFGGGIMTLMMSIILLVDTSNLRQSAIDKGGVVYSVDAKTGQKQLVFPNGNVWMDVK